jgi:shikimate kinase
MATGKTTVGRLVAERLQRRFVRPRSPGRGDRGHEGAPRLFRTQGEPAFRKVEAEALHRALKMDGIVLATGGGAACREEKPAGHAGGAYVVALSAPPAEVLQADGQGVGATAAGRRARSAGRGPRLLSEREPFYARAHLRIDTVGKRRRRWRRRCWPRSRGRGARMSRVRMMRVSTSPITAVTRAAVLAACWRRLHRHQRLADRAAGPGARGRMQDPRGAQQGPPRTDGTLDVALDRDYPYILYPLVRAASSPSREEGDVEPNRIAVTGARVRLEPPPGITVTFSDACPSEFDVPKPLSLDPRARARIALEAIRSCHAGLFRKLFDDGRLNSSVAERVYFSAVRAHQGPARVEHHPVRSLRVPGAGVLRLPAGRLHPAVLDVQLPADPPCSSWRTTPSGEPVQPRPGHRPHPVLRSKDGTAASLQCPGTPTNRGPRPQALSGHRGGTRPLLTPPSVNV